MPHWEDELRTILASLGVTLEDADGDWHMESADALEAPSDSALRDWEAQQAAAPPDTDDEFAVINREMEATVQEVARLVRTGRMEPALRDDVVFVLRALTHAQPIASADADEWRYTSAAAVLHFCRLVLRLAHALTHPDC
jgi:hypothetical protein